MHWLAVITVLLFFGCKPAATMSGGVKTKASAKPTAATTKPQAKNVSSPVPVPATPAPTPIAQTPKVVQPPAPAITNNVGSNSAPIPTRPVAPPPVAPPPVILPPQPKPNPLSGLWDAVGYTCGPDLDHLEFIPLEIISIEQNGTSFVGTKVTGDNCVGAGHITFQGTLIGNSLDVHYFRSTPYGDVDLNDAASVGTYSPTRIVIEPPPDNPAFRQVILTPHK